MGLFIQNTEFSSDLQKRITADLTEMAKKKTAGPAPKKVDGVSDSEYVKDLEQSKLLALSPAWWTLIILTIITVIIIIALASKGS